MPQRDDRSLDYISAKLDDMCDDVKEIKQDLKESRDALSMDVVHLKLQQEKCNSHWGLMGKSLSWGGISSLIGYFITLLFPPKIH